MGSKVIKLTLVLASLLFISCTYAVQIESFDYANDAAVQAEWIIGGNDVANGATSYIYMEPTIKKEGTSSVKFQYNYSGSQWYEMWAKKVFSTPQDFSNIKKYSFWLYNTSDSSSTMIWYIKFYTNTNCVYRYIDYNGLGFTGWQKVSFDLADMQGDPWTGSGYWDNPNLSNVTAVQFLIQALGGTSPGTATVYLDNLNGYQNSNLSITDNLFNFNYPNNDALTTAWIVSPSTGGTLAISTSTTSYFGNGSLQLYYQLTAYWYNIFNQHTLPAAMDMSNIQYFKFWIYGDTNANSSTSPVMLFTIQDTSDNRMWSRVNNGLKNPQWHELYMNFTPGPIDGSDGPFWQDLWDAGGSVVGCDYSAIGKIGINTQTGAAGNVNFTVYIDEIEYAYSTTIPLLASYYSVNVKPNDAPVTINAISGIGPFTWSISTGIGSLDTTSGNSVIYTPGNSVATGTITLYDDTGEEFVIDVSITPTSAPMFIETPNYTINRQSLPINWSLFE